MLNSRPYAPVLFVKITPYTSVRLRKGDYYGDLPILNQRFKSCDTELSVKPLSIQTLPVYLCKDQRCQLKESKFPDMPKNLPKKYSFNSVQGKISWNQYEIFRKISWKLASLALTLSCASLLGFVWTDCWGTYYMYYVAFLWQIAKPVISSLWVLFVNTILQPGLWVSTDKKNLKTPKAGWKRAEKHEAAIFNIKNRISD